MKGIIIQHTIKLCRTYGIKTLSMEDISHLACIPIKILNKYYFNKEALLKECILYRIHQEEIFRNTDKNLSEYLICYAESYPRLYQKINRRCCADIKKYYPSVYLLLTENIMHIARTYQNKVNEGIASGYIRKKTSPRLIYYFLQEHLTKLFSINTAFTNQDHLLLTEMILAFTRGISTPEGQLYIDEKLKTITPYETH